MPSPDEMRIVRFDGGRAVRGDVIGVCNRWLALTRGSAGSALSRAGVEVAIREHVVVFTTGSVDPAVRRYDEAGCLPSRVD